MIQVIQSDELDSGRAVRRWTGLGEELLTGVVLDLEAAGDALHKAAHQLLCQRHHIIVVRVRLHQGTLLSAFL